MKKSIVFFLSITLIALSISCDLLKKDDPAALGGSQSPMGMVGATSSSSSSPIAGTSNISASVTALNGTTSTITAQATVTNSLLKSLLANYPGTTVNGNTVSISNMQIESTTTGLKCITGPGAGIIVKYESNVGDTYPIGSTGAVRRVVSKSTTDDYPYGMLLIKTIQVESVPNYMKSTNAGVTKIKYIANHKFGLVGVMVSFDDGTSVTFPVYSSTQNP